VVDDVDAVGELQRCPDVCPTDLVAIAEMLRSLGPQAANVQPIFVTLDPERDKPEAARLRRGLPSRLRRAAR
jgi:cytochrome oxidase Cu insertion factor (SCO1/SenC/PrrC family)